MRRSSSLAGSALPCCFDLAVKVPLFATLLLATPMRATEPTPTAANAINALGIDLLRNGDGPNANALLSPYSIQSALAMTYAGAEGDSGTCDRSTLTPGVSGNSGPFGRGALATYPGRYSCAPLVRL